MQQTSLTPRVPFLTYICIASALGGFLWGFDAIVISGTIGPVKEQFQIAAFMEGLFVSSGLIGAVIGAALAGFLSDRFGRSRNLVLAAVLMLISAAASGFAWDVWSLIVARWIGGIGVGISAMVCPLYISEVSPAHLRGRMVTVFQFAITIGILVALLSNAAIFDLAVEHSETESAFLSWFVVRESWRAMFSAELLPGVIFLAMSFTLPESPRWLVKQRRQEQALRVLNRILKVGAEQELESIRSAIQKEEQTKVRYIDVFEPRYRKPLLIAVLLAVFAQFSGINVIFYYGPSILEQAGFEIGGVLDGFATIGFFNMIFTVVALWIVDKVGRRPLLTIGTVGAIACLCGIGLLLDSGTIVPLIALICGFVAFFAFSLGPIKFIFASEIFPTHIRSHALSIAILAMWTADTLVGYLFPPLRDALGASATFFIFALILAPQLLLIWRYMPETARLSLEEIEAWWQK